MKHANLVMSQARGKSNMAKKKKEEKPELMTEEFKEWPIEKMKVSDLKLADYNPRIITSSAREGLKNSIKKYGLVQNIVFNKRTGNVVGGHQRLKILQEENVQDVDVVVVDLPQEEEIALNVALNNPEIQGTFTEDAVKVLNDVSQTLQDSFKDLKLDELQQQLEAKYIDKNVEGKKPKPTTPKPDKLTKSKIPDDQVVVCCPKCKSEFRKSDKKVLYNSQNKETQAEAEEGKDNA